MSGTPIQNQDSSSSVKRVSPLSFPANRSLMATLPGYEVYLRYGFGEVERLVNVMPDGVGLELVRVEKAIVG